MNSQEKKIQSIRHAQRINFNSGALVTEWSEAQDYRFCSNGYRIVRSVYDLIVWRKSDSEIEDQDPVWCNGQL